MASLHFVFFRIVNTCCLISPESNLKLFFFANKTKNVSLLGKYLPKEKKEFIYYKTVRIPKHGPT